MALLRTVCALLAAVLLFGGAGVAQTESTPIPTSPKTDFSKMQFLTGNWTCDVNSSRRPGPYETTSQAAISSDGHWLVTRTLVHKSSWIPASFVSEDRMTYDPSTSRWVDISTDQTGGYNVSTSPGWKGNTIVWTDVLITKSNNTASTNPTTITKVSDAKTTSTNSFKEPSGRLVTVKTTCTKG